MVTPSKVWTPEKSPSYARPTTASENRIITKHHTREVKSRAPVPPSNVTRQKVVHSYSLSTTSTRAKAHSRRCPRRWLGPSRLFDLPAELRNRIYEYAGIERETRHVDMHLPSVKDASRCLPRLLRINKQLRDEAGDYYFSTGMFNVLVDRARMHLLMDWLQTMGLANRKRLAKNESVRIRLAYNKYECNDHEALVPVTSRSINEISFADAAHLAGLEVEFQRLAKSYPGLENWQFTSEMEDVTEMWPITQSGSTRYGATIWRSFDDMMFSSTFLVKLRAAMRGILAIFDGRKVDLADDGYREWMKSEMVLDPESELDCLDIMLKSGRRIAVYPTEGEIDLRTSVASFVEKIKSIRSSQYTK